MKKLHLYLIHRILSTAVFTTLVITCVIFLIRSLKLLELVINQGVPFGEYLYITVTVLPSSVAMILPISIAVATIGAYSRLSQESELIAMKTAGFSPRDLAMPALQVGLLAWIASTLIMAYVAPISYQEYRERYAEAKVKYITGLIREGQFASLGSDMTFFINKRLPKGQLEQVMLNDRRDPDLETTIFAQSGQIIPTLTGAVFRLTNGFQQFFKNNQLHVIEFNSYDIRFESAPIEKRLANAYQLTAWDLAQSLNDDGLSKLSNPDKAHSIFHQIFTTPMLNITFALLGAYMIITAPFTRHGGGMTNVKASLLITGLIIVNFLLKSLSARADSIFPIMYMVAYVPPVFLWYLLMRQSVRGHALPKTAVFSSDVRSADSPERSHPTNTAENYKEWKGKNNKRGDKS